MGRGGRAGCTVSTQAFNVPSGPEKRRQDLEQAQDDLSADEKKKVEAFTSYIDKTCGSEGE